jgi:hypothetical protein
MPYLLAQSVQHVSQVCATDSSKTCISTITFSVYGAHPGAPLATSTHNPLGSMHLMPHSGCTGCGWWFFGCPGWYHLHTQWDQQDMSGVPLYHIAWDTYDRTNCSQAWTTGQQPVCTSLFFGWSCGSATQATSWDGSYHHDKLWQPLTNTIFGQCVEKDVNFLQNSLSPSGWVNGYANQPSAGAC